MPPARIDAPLLREMAAHLSADDAAEMALPSYLHRNPAMRMMAWWRVDVLAERLRAAAAGRDGLTIVDYGCGSGVLLPDAAALGARVIGVDLILDAAKILIERRGLRNASLKTVAQAEAEIEPGSVDIIIAGEVLEHIEPLAPTLDVFRRWLRGPASLVLVTLPTENQLYRAGRRLAGFSGHYHHANAASISRDLERRGFRKLSKRSIPLPGLLSIYWCIDYARD